MELKKNEMNRLTRELVVELKKELLSSTTVIIIIIIVLLFSHLLSLAPPPFSILDAVTPQAPPGWGRGEYISTLFSW